MSEGYNIHTEVYLFQLWVELTSLMIHFQNIKKRSAQLIKLLHYFLGQSKIPFGDVMAMPSNRSHT